MANARIGSHPSHGYQVVETITEAKQLNRGDSGKYFMVDIDTNYIINLPKLSTEIAGWHAKFIISVSSGGGTAVQLMAYGLLADGSGTGDADTVRFSEIPGSDTGNEYAGSKDGCQLNDGATVGDMIEVFTDGTTWFYTAMAEDSNHVSDIG